MYHGPCPLKTSLFRFMSKYLPVFIEHWFVLEVKALNCSSSPEIENGQSRVTSLAAEHSLASSFVYYSVKPHHSKRRDYNKNFVTLRLHTFYVTTKSRLIGTTSVDRLNNT